MAMVKAHNLVMQYQKGSTDEGEPIMSSQKIKVKVGSTQENILKCGEALGTLLVNEPLVCEEVLSALA